MKILFLLAALMTCACAHAIDLKEFEQRLTSPEGVQGEIHGASPELGLYVFTYRNPKDFFDYLEMSMLAGSADVRTQFASLVRHDVVRIHGALEENPSPQPHIRVAKLDVVTKFKMPAGTPDYDYEAADLPTELASKTEALFLVHAVGAQGHILVVEYKDAVIPIFVENAARTAGLSRNDLVRIKFQVQRSPKRPMHLMIDETRAEPLKVEEAIASRHGKPADFTGQLVLFPKSPQILFNVFAVYEELPEGLSRQYTLVNFDNPDLFKQIRDKLQAAWDEPSNAWVNGRNKLVSTKIRVHARGTWNEVDPSQANAQILLDSLDAIEIVR